MTSYFDIVEFHFDHPKEEAFFSPELKVLKNKTTPEETNVQYTILISTLQT